LLRGVLDKSAFGNVEFGLIHAVNEIYGSDKSETLLSCLSRLLTSYTQLYGHSCGLNDLILNNDIEEKRRTIIKNSYIKGIKASYD
jgi:DNA-directed RNA polymerase I subunit RPA1